ncbi:hypothetical protein LMG9449_0310 [Lactococcus lactis subsp. lactis]|uniref:Uncharacterized protein n=1 Tax=Lactococcus lactis subsp. lactis TaxID=1360 RepID=A0A0V8E8V3_LACLL|nr:hypothetical protein [Lactococcus lactis]KSU22211.1 hypothetical protein LMG9449_0310 [Lactococcus lactis subsp. lactis]
MNEVREFVIGSYHTFTDWGCFIQSGWTLDSAKPKTKYVDIPGADGQLDLTSALTGQVNFDSREFKASLIFPITKNRSAWGLLKTTISNAINGQELKIRLPDDEGHFLKGRFSVGKYDDSTSAATLEISATLEPWRYKTIPTSVKNTISGTKIVPLENERKPALITIDTNAALTVKLEGKTVAIPIGKTEILDFVLKQGTNNLSITGTNAAITITYQEASL